MQLKPFAEIIALSKEKLDEILAGPRARKVKAQAELEMAELDTKIITLQTDAQELCTKKDGINFISLFDKLDEIALLERRKEQYGEVLSQLFPSKKEDLTA